MNELIKIEAPAGVTMSSLELVDFINAHEGRKDLTHANFMAKVPKVLGEGGLIQFQDTYIHPQNGQAYPCYRFPKREACLMAMSYSYELQAKVFDRMTELEGRKFEIPQTYAQALLLAANQAVQIEQQSAIIEQQAPKVEFYDAVAEAINSQTIYEVAKELGIGSKTLFKFLREKEVLIKKRVLPYQVHIDAGRFRVIMKKYKDPRGEIQTYQQALVTGKGAIYIQKLVSAHPELKSKGKKQSTP